MRDWQAKLRIVVIVLERDLIEAVLQDREDTSPCRRTDRQRTRAGSLDAIDRVSLRVADQREARAVALLGMRAVSHDRVDERAGARAKFSCPRNDPRWRPRAVLPVRLGP